MNQFSVSKEYADSTCKIGRGEACCKYLVVSGDGLECAKLNLGIRQLIDNRTNMTSKGDNCNGKPDELASFLFE